MDTSDDYLPNFTKDVLVSGSIELLGVPIKPMIKGVFEINAMDWDNSGGLRT
jgi:hypothetical protein